MPWLIAIVGGIDGKRFSLDAPCLVGRGPYNHVVLEDKGISRQHAKVSPERGGHVVYDLNSANGTFVNEVSVKRHKLEANDVVRFGPFSFRFELDATSQPFAMRKDEDTTHVGFDSTKIVESIDPATSTGPHLTSGLAQLEDSERKLHSLYGLMESLATTLDVNELSNRLLQHLLEVFHSAESATIHLHEADDERLVPWLALRRTGGRFSGTALSAQLVEEVVQKGRAVLSAPVDGTRRQTPRKPSSETIRFVPPPITTESTPLARTIASACAKLAASAVSR